MLNYNSSFMQNKIDVFWIRIPLDFPERIDNLVKINTTK